MKNLVKVFSLIILIIFSSCEEKEIIQDNCGEVLSVKRDIKFWSEEQQMFLIRYTLIIKMINSGWFVETSYITANPDEVYVKIICDDKLKNLKNIGD